MILKYSVGNYPGIQPRPASEFIHFENEKLILAATPWGNNNALEILQQTIKDRFLGSQETQATAVSTDFFSASFSSQKLKNIISEANTSIIEKANKTNYNSAIEAMLIQYKDGILSWIQIGQPSLLLLREGKLIVLEADYDLSLNFSQAESLPSKLVGIENTINLNFKTLNVQQNDIFILFCGKSIPASFIGIKKFKKELQELTDQLLDVAVKENKENSFWISCFNFSSNNT